MPQALGALIISAINAVVDIGITAATSVTVAGAQITAAEIIGTVAFQGLAIGAGALLAPGAPTPQSQKVNVKSPVQPRRRGYGTAKIGGTLAFIRRESVTTGGGILYVVVMLHQGKIDSIVDYYIYDQLIRIDQAGTRPGPAGQVIYPGVWLDNNRVQMDTLLGDAVQTSDVRLQTAFPNAWTSEHRLNGIAYLVCKAEGVALNSFSAVYKAGIPNLTCVARLSLVWDPRDNTQSADDQTTWKWSDNAALVIMDYVWNPDGMRLPFSMIESEIDDWKAKANCCDELVPLLNGGTEKRYRLSGVYDLSEPPKSVLPRMLVPIDGRLRLTPTGGIVLDIGEFCDPPVTIADEDILEFDLRHGAPKTQLKNEIRATYTAPGFFYEQQEADPWVNLASIDVDGLLSTTLNLDWCPSQSQARRIMKVNAFRLNPDWQGTVKTNARGALLLGLRYVTLQISVLGINTTFYIQKSNIDLLNGVCTFDVVSFPSDAYDFDPLAFDDNGNSEEGISPEANTPGDQGFMVPKNSTQIVIAADGAGGGGVGSASVSGGGTGGGGGARVLRTVAVSPADWGKVILYHVGNRGMGEDVDFSGSLATDGEDSTVNGTLAAGVISMRAGGGKRGTTSPGNGGVATGGDGTILSAGGDRNRVVATHTINGGNGHGSTGGGSGALAPNDQYPGGGGSKGFDGQNGSVWFDVTF